MKKGDKVPCVNPDEVRWPKTSKPAPKKGWVYLVKAIASFDDAGRQAARGTRFGIELEGVKSRVGDGPQFFASSAFRLIENKPVKFPKRKE